MPYIVYQTTNTLDGRVYIGVHKQDDPWVDDGYRGSNIHLRRAIKKYGIECFKREVLVIGSKHYAYNVERVLVDEAFSSRTDTYNLMVGGEGGGGWHKKGTPLSEAHKRKIGDAVKGESNGMYGVKYVGELLQKCREGQLRRFRGPGGPAARRKISRGLRLRYQGPRGKIHRQNQSDTMRKLAWVYLSHTSQIRRVPSEELSVYLQAGWQLGRGKATSAEAKAKMSTANKGRISVYSDENQQNKFVRPEELELYLHAGWVRGRKVFNSVRETKER